MAPVQIDLPVLDEILAKVNQIAAQQIELGAKLDELSQYQRRTVDLEKDMAGLKQHYQRQLNSQVSVGPSQDLPVVKSPPDQSLNQNQELWSQQTAGTLVPDGIYIVANLRISDDDHIDMVEETCTILPDECASNLVPGVPASGPLKPPPKKPRLEHTQDCAGSGADDAMDIGGEGDNVGSADSPEPLRSNTSATNDRPSSPEARDCEKLRGLFNVRSHQDQAICTQGQGSRLAHSSVVQKESRTSMRPPSRTPQQGSQTHIDLTEDRPASEPFSFPGSTTQTNQAPNNPIRQAALNGQRLTEAVNRAAQTTDPFFTARRHETLKERFLDIHRQKATKNSPQKPPSHSERQTPQSAQSTSRARIPRTAQSSQVPRSQPTQTLATDSGSDTPGHRPSRPRRATNKTKKYADFAFQETPDFNDDNVSKNYDMEFD